MSPSGHRPVQPRLPLPGPGFVRCTGESGRVGTPLNNFIEKIFYQIATICQFYRLLKVFHLFVSRLVKQCTGCNGAVGGEISLISTQPPQQCPYKGLLIAAVSPGCCTLGAGAAVPGARHCTVTFVPPPNIFASEKIFLLAKLNGPASGHPVHLNGYRSGDIFSVLFQIFR